MNPFDESKHPRDGGKFAAKAGAKQPAKGTHPAGMTYGMAQALRSHLEAERKKAAAALEAAAGSEKTSMGLTPDHIKATPEWKKARAAFDAASDAEKQHVQLIVKHFSKEEKASRAAAQLEREKLRGGQ